MAEEPRRMFQGSAAHLAIPPEQQAWVLQLETILEEQGEITTQRGDNASKHHQGPDIGDVRAVGRGAASDAGGVRAEGERGTRRGGGGGGGGSGGGGAGGGGARGGGVVVVSGVAGTTAGDRNAVQKPLDDDKTTKRLAAVAKKIEEAGGRRGGGGGGAGGATAVAVGKGVAAAMGKGED